ncbi:MAG: cupin domain-containing protein [Acholeplasmataceae bacterium]
MVGHIKDLEKVIFTTPLAKDAGMRVLVSKENGWKDHVMRVVEVEEKGYTPKHQHPWPHINYFLEGEGELEIGGEVFSVKAGSYAFVPGDTLHQFRNTSSKHLKFICIVPTEGHQY